MLGCYKYAARPVLVVMASARNMTREMKNLQELKEEAGRRVTKNLFLRHRQRHRERAIHAFSQLLGENLIYCDGTHSQHSLQKINIRPAFYFCGCVVIAFDHKIFHCASAFVAAWTQTGVNIALWSWTRGKYWLGENHFKCTLMENFWTLAYIVLAAAVSSWGSILYYGDRAEYFCLKGQENDFGWRVTSCLFSVCVNMDVFWSSRGANLKL